MWPDVNLIASLASQRHSLFASAGAGLYLEPGEPTLWGESWTASFCDVPFLLGEGATPGMAVESLRARSAGNTAVPRAVELELLRLGGPSLLAAWSAYICGPGFAPLRNQAEWARHVLLSFACEGVRLVDACEWIAVGASPMDAAALEARAIAPAEYQMYRAAFERRTGAVAASAFWSARKLMTQNVPLDRAIAYARAGIPDTEVDTWEWLIRRGQMPASRLELYFAAGVTSSEVPSFESQFAVGTPGVVATLETLAALRH